MKYFSGIAAYVKELDLAGDLFGPDKRLFLDLGRVRFLAEVHLNDQPVGIVWTPPFRVDICPDPSPPRFTIEGGKNKMDPFNAIVVKVLRETRGLGLAPMDLAMGVVDEAHAKGEITDGEIDLAYTDAEGRIERFTSNDSPCWECGLGAGDMTLLWMEDLSEYRHEVCP